MSAAGFEGGSGPDVVLLHGLGSRWQIFVPVLADLTATHRVHAFDLPGFGAEAGDAALRPGVLGFADWVGARLSESGIREPHVVGSSMGGAVALELGRRGVAARVTVFSPTGFWSPIGRAWCQAVLTLMRAAARAMPAALGGALRTAAGRGILLACFFGRPRQVEPEAAVADLAALAGASGFDAARAAFATHPVIDPHPTVPTVIVWGRRDVILPFLTQARRARRAFPGARHIALGGCGHLPFADDPAACAGIIAGTHPFTRRTTEGHA